jgi:hypothetical protein
MLGFVWEAGNVWICPRLELAIESSSDEVWPLACNSPSQGGNFEGMRLLLGVAYVHTELGSEAGARVGEKGQFLLARRTSRE